MKSLFTCFLTFHIFSVGAYAGFEELDPFSPGIEKKVKELDEFYRATAMSKENETMIGSATDCYQFSCKVFLEVLKSTQTAILYIEGEIPYEWDVSTGRDEVDEDDRIVKRHETPNFDRHPDGRVFDKYSSSKYTGGDYEGLGNMPYAVFIKGPFAIHGTSKGNWRNLGYKASHGCIRLHPDNAKIFNRLVRKYGVRQTWITVRD